MSLSRRALFAGAGLAEFTASGLQYSSSAVEKPNHLDVVVVAAGLSGLMAARQLKKSGMKVHILEARERTGGRTPEQRIV